MGRGETPTSGNPANGIPGHIFNLRHFEWCHQCRHQLRLLRMWMFQIYYREEIYQLLPDGHHAWKGQSMRNEGRRKQCVSAWTRSSSDHSGTRTHNLDILPAFGCSFRISLMPIIGFRRLQGASSELWSDDRSSVALVQEHRYRRRVLAGAHFPRVIGECFIFKSIGEIFETLSVALADNGD